MLYNGIAPAADTEEMQKYEVIIGYTIAIKTAKGTKIMKNSIKITSLCLIGCLYTTVGLADGKKAIWGTDGAAITKKPIPEQTIKPKTAAQINPKRVETMNEMSGMGGMSGKKPQINPKPQTETMTEWGPAIADIAPKINPKPQIKPKTVKDAKLDPIDK